MRKPEWAWEALGMFGGMFLIIILAMFIFGNMSAYWREELKDTVAILGITYFLAVFFWDSFICKKPTS